MSGRRQAVGAAAAGVAWGLAEGTLFFVVPDVLLTRTALASPRRALAQCLAAVAGAVVAGVLLYGWSAADPAGARRAVAAVPWIRTPMFETASTALADAPLAGMLRGSFGGIPYKVFAVEAPGHVGLPAFLAATAVARAPRFLLGVTLGALGATLLRRFAGLGARGLALAHAAAWVVFYAYYWSMV